MKIKMHSLYDHFPNHRPVDGEPYIDCYNDHFVMGKVNPGSIALLIEPRSIQPKVYDYMLIEGYRKFDYVFTHDSELLHKVPNAKLILWGGVWDWSDEPKTKFCSMISSDKEMCDLHIFRKNLAKELKDTIDCYGTFDGGPRADTHTCHAPYRFAIVIENYIDYYWFTEKICNCFANKVVPIYMGALRIDKFFNDAGIIKLNNKTSIKTAVEVMQGDYGIEWYNSRLKAINDNYELVQRYERFETWFFRKYEGLLYDLYSKTQGIR